MEKLNKLCIKCSKKCKQLSTTKIIKCPNYTPILHDNIHQDIMQTDVTLEAEDAKRRNRAL